MKILVIDDEAPVRIMIRATLEKSGFSIVEGADGRDCMTALTQDPEIGLVILDIIMPDQEGIETIIEMKKKFPHVKVVAISGGGHIGPKNYLDIARNLGAVATLAKPFSRTELLQAVQAALG